MADPALIAEGAINTSADIATELAIKLGSIGKWLQAIGIIVVLWMVIQIINWILSRKKIKRLDHIEERMEKIEKKLDKVLKKH